MLPYSLYFIPLQKERNNGFFVLWKFSIPCLLLNRICSFVIFFGGECPHLLYKEVFLGFFDDLGWGRQFLWFVCLFLWWLLWCCWKRAWSRFRPEESWCTKVFTCRYFLFEADKAVESVIMGLAGWSWLPKGQSHPFPSLTARAPSNLMYCGAKRFP